MIVEELSKAENVQTESIGDPHVVLSPRPSAGASPRFRPQARCKSRSAGRRSDCSSSGSTAGRSAGRRA